MTDLETFANDRFAEKWTEAMPGLMLVRCVRKDAPDLPESVQSKISVPEPLRDSTAKSIATIAVGHLLRQVGDLWLNAPAIILPGVIEIGDEEEFISFTLPIEGTSYHPDRAK